MLRDFIVNGAKAPESMYRADAELKTGMVVVKDETTKSVDVTTEETVADIFFVDKERVPEGVDCARGDIPDYDDAFTVIKDGERLVLEKYHAGETFGTDQFKVDDFKEGTAIGTRVAFVNGIAIKATKPSQYIFKGLHNDNKHTLIKIEVSDTAVANA